MRFYYWNAFTFGFEEKDVNDIEIFFIREYTVCCC